MTDNPRPTATAEMVLSGDPNLIRGKANVWVIPDSVLAALRDPTAVVLPGSVFLKAQMDACATGRPEIWELIWAALPLEWRQSIFERFGEGVYNRMPAPEEVEDAAKDISFYLASLHYVPLQLGTQPPVPLIQN